MKKIIAILGIIGTVGSYGCTPAQANTQQDAGAHVSSFDQPPPAREVVKQAAGEFANSASDCYSGKARAATDTDCGESDINGHSREECLRLLVCTN